MVVLTENHEIKKNNLKPPKGKQILGIEKPKIVINIGLTGSYYENTLLFGVDCTVLQVVVIVGLHFTNHEVGKLCRCIINNIR